MALQRNERFASRIDDRTLGDPRFASRFAFAICYLVFALSLVLPARTIFPLADSRLGATISVHFKTLSSSGLGHSPFTGVTRVRIPLGSRKFLEIKKLRLNKN